MPLLLILLLTFTSTLFCSSAQAAKNGTSSYYKSNSYISQNNSERRIRYSPAENTLPLEQQYIEKAINSLLGQLGKPYRLGGDNPAHGFDCSGLIYYAYHNLLNIKLPRTARDMFRIPDIPSIDKYNLRLGDLVFFRIKRATMTDHVGVYIGNGQFIQAPRAGKKITISELNDNYWEKHYVGARRLLNAQTSNKAYALAEAAENRLSGS